LLTIRASFSCSFFKVKSGSLLGEGFKKKELPSPQHAVDTNWKTVRIESLSLLLANLAPINSHEQRDRKSLKNRKTCNDASRTNRRIYKHFAI